MEWLEKFATDKSTYPKALLALVDIAQFSETHEPESLDKAGHVVAVYEFNRLVKVSRTTRFSQKPID